MRKNDLEFYELLRDLCEAQANLDGGSVLIAFYVTTRTKGMFSAGRETSEKEVSAQFCCETAALLSLGSCADV